MASFSRIMVLGGLIAAPMLGFAGAAHAGSCAPAGLTVACTVFANQDVNSLNPNSVLSPLSTGVTFGVGSTYVLTVTNPSTTWSYDGNLTSVTANGKTPPGLDNGALVGQVGGATDGTGAFAVSRLGAVAVNGAVANGLGGTASYTPGGGLTLAMLDSDKGNNSGSQSVRVTQAPAVGGSVLANVNVFARQNSLNSTGAANPLGGAAGAVSAGLTLLAGQTYSFVTTDAQHLWSMGEGDSRLSTADGIPTAPFGDCGAADGCAPIGGGVFEAAVTQFHFGELVARIGNTYYRVGNARVLTGVAGNLSFLNWDNLFSDNDGFMNVSVSLVPSSVATPEPASLALIGSGLVGLALLRRRRGAA